MIFYFHWTIAWRRPLLPAPKPEKAPQILKPTKVRYEDRRKERVKR